jgi:hypothetical protein
MSCHQNLWQHSVFRSTRRSTVYIQWIKLEGWHKHASWISIAGLVRPLPTLLECFAPHGGPLYIFSKLIWKYDIKTCILNFNSWSSPPLPTLLEWKIWKQNFNKGEKKIYRFEHRLKGDARNEINLDQPSLGYHDQTKLRNIFHSFGHV